MKSFWLHGTLLPVLSIADALGEDILDDNEAAFSMTHRAFRSVSM